MRNLIVPILLIGSLCSFVFACQPSSVDYIWSNVTNAANYPQGYNYPVFVFGEKMVALNNGAWVSTDAKNWKKTGLPDSGLNSAYQKFVYFNGAIYALGSLTGNYQDFSISTKILRTTDLEKWETVAETSNLPQRIFYGLTVFDDKIWLVGGYDGKSYHSDVWNSIDGINWTQVTENAAWSPRTTTIVAFNNKLWILGGGEIDGDTLKNPGSYKELWSATDGKNWTKVKTDLARKWRGTPVVFDSKLWLIGANRGGGFESAVWVTGDGSKWSELPAPWSPRGAVAAWVHRDTLFMTGGKSSHTENGEIKFVYSNDVWVMKRKTE